MDKTPDPMAQIEAALDKLVWALHAGPYGEEKAALLALIRSALAAQPGQGEAENAWKQLECVGLSVRGRQVTLLFKNDPTAKAAFKRLNGINATPPTPAPDEAGVRAKFEAWAVEHSFPTLKNAWGDYCTSSTIWAYEGYRAALRGDSNGK